MRKIQRRDFLKAMGLATAALGLTACGGSGAASTSSASSVSSAPASSRDQSRPCRAPCDPVPDRGTDHRRLHLQGTVHSL
ncbi:twin-arginine translocation signal domain-containing protein [Faecalibacterium sp. HTF-128]|uniref:Twin-arginine translocation signal domain-containing protein n=1 Tax=Faecalibacterium wellingii TaxID=2929491 RepID=A0AB35Y9R7_9FIRM